MSEQLRALGIAVREGYREEHLRELEPDLVLIGNALRAAIPRSRRCSIAACPMPQGRSGSRASFCTSVKSSRSRAPTARPPPRRSPAFLLDRLGLAPGFLIGGVARDFPLSARVGSGELFVIEADEYDTAFLRQTRQVPALPAADRGAQQPRVRPRRHLSRPRLHRAPVPPFGTHGTPLGPARGQSGR